MTVIPNIPLEPLLGSEISIENNAKAVKKNENKAIYKSTSVNSVIKDQVTKMVNETKAQCEIAPDMLKEIDKLHKEVQDLYDKAIDCEVTLKTERDELEEQSIIAEQILKEAEAHNSNIIIKLSETQAQLEKAKVDYPNDTEYLDALEERIISLEEMKKDSTSNIVLLNESLKQYNDYINQIDKQFAPAKFSNKKQECSPEQCLLDLEKNKRGLTAFIETSKRIIDGLYKGIESMVNSIKLARNSLESSKEKLASMEEIQPSPENRLSLGS